MNRIKVISRIRPLSSLEIERGDEVVTHVSSEQLHIISSNGIYPTKSFALDYILKETSSQPEVFMQISPNLESLLSGFNSCICTYGQTGSGKTHTMLGIDMWNLAADNLNHDKDFSSFNQDPDTLGIIPRCLAWLFDKRDAIQRISVSYIEIFNEKVFDLLDTGNNRVSGLDIRETKSGGIVIPNLTIVDVENISQALEVLWVGAKSRSIASTNANEYSSRSHTIFSVLLKSSRNSILTASKLTLVDLAGSEKWTSSQLSKLAPERVSESIAINKSLSALGKCISALSQGFGHIPYRDSKLTRYLQDSIGGNSNTLFFVTLSPSYRNIEETISTLQFADRAMKVQIYAVQNKIKRSDEDTTFSSTEKTNPQTLYELETVWRLVSELALRLDDKDLRECLSTIDISDRELYDKIHTTLFPVLFVNQRESIIYEESERSNEDDDAEDYLNNCISQLNNFDYLDKNKDLLIENSSSKNNDSYVPSSSSSSSSSGGGGGGGGSRSSTGGEDSTQQLYAVMKRMAKMESSLQMQAGEFQHSRKLFTKTNEELKQKLDEAKEEITGLYEQQAADSKIIKDLKNQLRYAKKNISDLEKQIKELTDKKIPSKIESVNISDIFNKSRSNKVKYKPIANPAVGAVPPSSISNPFEPSSNSKQLISSEGLQLIRSKSVNILTSSSSRSSSARDILMKEAEEILSRRHQQDGGVASQFPAKYTPHSTSTANTSSASNITNTAARPPYSIPKELNPASLKSLTLDDLNNPPHDSRTLLFDHSSASQVESLILENKSKNSKSKKSQKSLWKELFDSNSKKNYYYNRITKVTTWIKPSDEELKLTVGDTVT